MPRRTADDTRMLDLRRGAELDAEVVERLVSASNAFSNQQMDLMLNAGIRAWPMVGSKSPYSGVKMPPPAARAAYFPPTRVIVARDNAKTDDLRHELAHAWDHMKGGHIKGRLDKLTEAERSRVLGADIVRWSEKAREAVTPLGAKKATQMTLLEMRDAYKKRLLQREDAFDNPGTREGYSRTSVAEFYAEGYSVYHGHCDMCQARMLDLAPELFEVLEREAKQFGLRRLDRKKVVAALNP